MNSLVLAISGGVDSMVLLDEMARRPSQKRLVVAHVNHGIRPDSGEDERLVEHAARNYGLQYYSTQLQLGAAASEDLARQRRYEWLRQLADEHNAEAIVTAHHQDDVIETIFINLVRGTGWRGLVSLRSHEGMLRPLINKTKADLLSYAIDNNLSWHEDSTNDDPRYLRNYIRMVLMPRLSPEQRRQLAMLYDEQIDLQREVDDEVDRLVSGIVSSQTLPRYFLIMLPPEVSYEIVRHWLGRNLTNRQQQRLTHFVATAKPGAIIELEAGCSLQATSNQLVAHQAYIR